MTMNLYIELTDLEACNAWFPPRDAQLTSSCWKKSKRVVDGQPVRNFVPKLKIKSISQFKERFLTVSMTLAKMNHIRVHVKCKPATESRIGTRNITGNGFRLKRSEI
ncbi:hypothetical protein EVAR_100870_1 [Eumeta japonica]|uniref:Uncharacterized protein n=1 Tax=Eumeta variegata TaxID=151549 RepID=A0A4C1T0I1_EUMVA|nr:hypothetical protein EVAR_100870_1 [Eumeta japonica]